MSIQGVLVLFHAREFLRTLYSYQSVCLPNNLCLHPEKQRRKKKVPSGGFRWMNQPNEYGIMMMVDREYVYSNTQLIWLCFFMNIQCYGIVFICFFLCSQWFSQSCLYYFFFFLMNRSCVTCPWYSLLLAFGCVCVCVFLLFRPLSIVPLRRSKK